LKKIDEDDDSARLVEVLGVQEVEEDGAQRFPSAAWLGDVLSAG
jgi:hypothetical protein